MRAEIVSIGTELLLGTITDTNASYLAQRLAMLGIDCYYVSQVGDNLERLLETFNRAWERSDLVIATGGLGPTQDDLTREAISKLLGERMEIVPELEADLRAFFQRRGALMPERNLKQATRIPSARIIPNPVGTAPGWWISCSSSENERTIIAMPGVPFEMKRMWEHEVEPVLHSESKDVIISKTLKVLGMGESAVEAEVEDLMNGSNPTLAPYAKADGIHLRMTAKAPDIESAERLIEGLEPLVRERLGDAIYGVDTDKPGDVVRRLLEDFGYTFCLLEVGPLVVGAISPLLAASTLEASNLGVGSISVESLSSLPKLVGSLPVLGEHTDSVGFEEAAEAIRSATGADVLLGVCAETGNIADDTVKAVSVEMIVIMPDSPQEMRVTKMSQTWKTEVTVVKRLAGLAAFNALRLHLLKIRKQSY